MNVNTIDNKDNNPEASKTASIWASLTKNQKLCWFLLFVGVVFAVMNWLTPMITDDYFYMFHSFHGKCDGTHPIQTPWDVVTSQIDHYLWHNGRMAVHVTLQSIDALFGKWLFNLLNPLWFVAYILLTVRFATGRYGFRPAVAMVFILLWVMPIFNELYLWMAGSLNYLWASVVVVWFLIKYPKHEHRAVRWKSVGWLLFALMAGWTHEGISIPLAGGLLLASLPKLRNGWKKEGIWTTLVFTAGALLCMVPSLQEGQSGDSLVLSDIISHKLSVGLDVMTEMRLVYIFIVLLIVAWARKRIQLKSFVKENSVLLTAIFVTVGIVLYVGVENNCRTGYMMEFSSLILILKLLPRFPLVQRWKHAATVVALIAIAGIMVPVVWYSGVNAKEHSAIVSQIKEGKNLIVLDSQPFPGLIGKNVCRTINFYTSPTEIYDPDGNLCSAIAANFKEVEFLSFCPKPVYDTYLNNPEKLSDVTDLNFLPLYVTKLDEPVQLDAVYLNFRAAEKDEIPLLLRPFAGWLSKYQERRFNAEFAVVSYDGDCFLYIEKPDGYDSRLTEVEVVESDPDATMPDYGPWDVDLPETNLPIVMVDTRGKDGEQQAFDRNERKVMRMKVIMNPDGINYGDTIDHPGQHADFDGWVAIRYRGSNSYVNSPKKPYSVKTIMTGDIESRGLKTPMMGMPADDDWVLIAPYQDRSQIRDVLMFELAGPWMEYVPRARHCELVIDGIYHGIYIMAERPGKGKNRLNLEKTGNEGMELTGGYLLEVDRDEEGKYFTSDYVRMDEDSTEYPVYVQLKYPKYNKITDRQLEYIQGRFREMEDALLSDQFADPQNGYRKYIDEQSFIDYMLSQEASLNIDGYRLSAYLYKHRDDVDPRFKTTLWDFNLAFGNTNLCGGYLTDFWGYDNPYIPDDEPIRDPFWWKRLTEDPAFMQKLKSRWAEYRRGSYSDAHVEAVIDSLTSMLDEKDALDRNFKRWNTWGEPIWGVYAWKEADTYKEEISYLKDWIRKRFSWMDRQLGR